MRNFVMAAAVVAAGTFAAPALAQDTGWQDTSAQVEKSIVSQTAPSARELQSAVDAYLASAKADATLVGGAGSAGYDGGFWIRGGSFLMKINLTLQTRWEYFDWDDAAERGQRRAATSPGFSLPRVTLKFSGDATCDVHYYAELEFGHSGSYYDNATGFESIPAFFGDSGSRTRRLGACGVDYGIAREAWIEYEAAPQVSFRMGLVKTPTTRQLMTPPEMQQFVDISIASAFIGQTMPGYTRPQP